MPLPTGVHSPEKWRETFHAWGQEMKTASFKEAWEWIAERLREDFTEHYLNTQAPYGIWPPRVDNLPHPLLRLSLGMFEATTNSFAEGNISEVEDRSLIVGVAVDEIPYAGYQQWGTARMPARPYLWVSERAIDDCFDLFVEHAYEVLVA